MKRWVLMGATIAGVTAYLWKKQQTPPRQGDWSAATDPAPR